MDSFRDILRPLLNTFGFNEISSQSQGSNLVIVFQSDASNSMRSTINLRVVPIPSSQEVMVYVHAPSLLPKILTLKIHIPSNANKLRGVLFRGLILNVFPPLTMAPALAHVPDCIIHTISTFLPVVEVIALSCTNCRIQRVIRSDNALWEELLVRDFPVFKYSKKPDESTRSDWYRAYQSNYNIRAAHRRQARFRHEHHPFHLMTPPAVPQTPSLLADFFFDDDWSGIPRPLSLQPPVLGQIPPPQHLPFPFAPRPHADLTTGSAAELSPLHESYFQHRDLWF